ncbi:MAG: hypothetical protein ACI4MR_03080 [Candidatus Aphodomorpha sp.]
MQKEITMSMRACLSKIALAIILLSCSGCHDAANPSAGAFTAIPVDSEYSHPIADLYVGCEDDGLHGIGTVRGNSNGNLLSSGGWGRAVCDETAIYYVQNGGYRYGAFQIVRYDMQTCDSAILVDDFDGAAQVGQLNLLNGWLYFAVEMDGNHVMVQRLEISTGVRETVCRFQTLSFMLAAYERLFVCDTPAGQTRVLDSDGRELAVLENFILVGAMDGILYGYRQREGHYVALDAAGQQTARYADAGAAVPINGHLIFLNTLSEDAPLSHSGTVTIVQVETGETTAFEVPEIPCASYFNVSDSYLYLQRYGADESGELYRIDWNGADLIQIDARTFDTGVSLWNDVPLIDVVPCDPVSNPLPA